MSADEPGAGFTSGSKNVEAVFFDSVGKASAAKQTPGSPRVLMAAAAQHHPNGHESDLEVHAQPARNIVEGKGITVVVCNFRSDIFDTGIVALVHLGQTGDTGTQSVGPFGIKRNVFSRGSGKNRGALDAAL